MPLTDNISLKGKLEAAFRDVIIANSGRPNLVVYKGTIAIEQVEGDGVVCACKRGPEEPLGSGNRWMEISVQVQSRADLDAATNPDPVGNHNANLNAVFEDVLSFDDIADQLTATQVNFKVFMVFDDGEDSEFEGRDFVEGRKYRVYCCNAAIG